MIFQKKLNIGVHHKPECLFCQLIDGRKPYPADAVFSQ